MEQMKLCALIDEAQKNHEKLYNLLLVFEPLLKKYARLLNMPDSYPELRAAFIEIILRMDVGKMANPTDGAIILYIQTAVRRRYISLAKDRRLYTQIHIFSEGAGIDESVRRTAQPAADPDFIERDYLRSYLTETEYEIILLYIFYGYTIAEIARGKGLSRQAVNQQKRSAMEKLRNAAKDI